MYPRVEFPTLYNQILTLTRCKMRLRSGAALQHAIDDLRDGLDLEIGDCDCVRFTTMFKHYQWAEEW